MQQIAPGIYYEACYPGVTVGALIFDRGTILIDAPLRAEDSRSWRLALLNLGSSPNRVLVNLDFHPDRTLGARAMDCPIIVHQRTAQVFRGRPTIFKGQGTDSGAEWETSNDVVGTRWAIPDIIFSEQLSFHWDEGEVILQHRPGPTLGSLWVVIPAAKVIFVGDTVLPDQTPFLASADLPAWIASLDVLLNEYPDYTFISGRDGLVGREAVFTQRRLLTDILENMEQLARLGVPSEMTEELIEDLLTSFSMTPDKQEQYIQRLRHGLYQYYNRRHRSADSTANQD